MTENVKPCPSPLSGIVVLEFGHVISGPLCGMMLADLGADVIKIESPQRPDMLRSSGTLDPATKNSLAFETVNRGKRSMTLDLTNDSDQSLLDQLLLSTDVVIENFRPGVADRIGIGYERVSAINPRIVHVSVSGFGQTGPLSRLGGYDMVAQAMSGLMSVTGEAGLPTKIGVPVADVACALYATIGVLAALRARDQCGHGQAVDCSLFDAALSFGIWESAEYFGTGAAPQASGNSHRALAPYQPLQASDGPLIIAANTDQHFALLVDVLEIPELATDPRFCSNSVRVANKAELASLLEKITITMPRQHWCDLLREVGVPCGEILDFRESLNHPQALARDMVATLESNASKRQRVLGSAIKLSHTPIHFDSPAPTLGEHTAEISEALGTTDSK